MGSTSYITDASGEVYQHLETEERGSQTPIKIIPNSEQYSAFGGTFVEEHSNTDRTPYLFNGKELDEETGLYYYGARYYDERTSIWLSVDPLAEKYPGFSPYVYVSNRPTIAVDPNGRDIIFIVDSEAADDYGHIAVLIGNETDGWTYVSINGTGEGAKLWGKNKKMLILEL